MAAQFNLGINARANYTKIAPLGEQYSGSPNITQNTLLDPTLVNLVFESSATISTGTSFDLNAVTDQFGNSLNFVTCSYVVIKNTGTGNITITGNLFGSDSFTLGAGLTYLNGRTITVVNTTADTLTLTPTGTTTYQLIIVGS